MKNYGSWKNYIASLVPELHCYHLSIVKTLPKKKENFHRRPSSRKIMTDWQMKHNKSYIRSWHCSKKRGFILIDVIKFHLSEISKSVFLNYLSLRAHRLCKYFKYSPSCHSFLPSYNPLLRAFKCISLS